MASVRPRFRITTQSRLHTKYLNMEWVMASQYTLDKLNARNSMACLSVQRICRIATVFDGGSLFFYYSEGFDWNAIKVQSWLREQIRNYVYQRAETVLPARLHQFEAKHHLYARSVSVKKLNGRTLGFCTAFNQIVLSPRIMFLSEYDMDSVILHEMAHLRYKHHKASFWKFLSVLLGENAWQQHVRRNANSAKLYAYSAFFCK